jgi:hypothetical protein
MHLRHHLLQAVVFSSSSQDNSNNSKVEAEMALETEIPRNHLYRVLIPPELLYIPSDMALAQFRAMETTVSLLVPEDPHACNRVTKVGGPENLTLNQVADVRQKPATPRTFMFSLLTISFGKSASSAFSIVENKTEFGNHQQSENSYMLSF